MPWLLQVLGTVTVQRRGDLCITSHVTQPRQVALLCYLMLARPRGLHSRDTLITLLWPEHSIERGRRALRNALHGLRQRLGAEAILSVGDGLVGVDPHWVHCDALDVEAHAARGEQCAVPVDVEPFEGLHVTEAATFDQWLSLERQRLKGLLAHAHRQPLASTGHAANDASNGSGAVHPQPTHRTPSLHSPDAYAMYVRGHYLFLRAAPGGAPADLMQARECFERALALDASYAPALAGLANFYAVAARRGILAPFHETFARTIAYSHQALALDDQLAIPHVHFGVQALYLHDDWEAAGREFAMAAALEPQYAEGRRFYGVWLGLVNRHDYALREMEAAALLEPDIPHMLSSLAAARLAVGDMDGAEAALVRTLEIDPRHPPARERLLRLYERQHRYGDAVALRERMPPMGGAVECGVAWRADGAEGYRAVRVQEVQREAAQLEARLIEHPAVTVNDIFAPPVVRLVTLYAILGEWKRAHAWQLQACAERPAMARWFASVQELKGARPL